MSEKRFELDRTGIFDNKTNHFYYKTFDNEEVGNLLNKLSKENEQLKNELKKVKSLLEYSDSMYDSDLIVNIRFTNGKWKADVSVIDDE